MSEVEKFQSQLEAARKILIDRLKADLTRLSGEDTESAIQLAGIKDVAGTIDALDRVAGPRRPKQGRLVLAFLVTLVFVSALVFLHVPETEVEAKLSVTAIGIEAQQGRILGDVIPVVEIEAAGISGLILPDGGKLDTLHAGASHVRLSICTDASAAMISLPPISITGMTQIRMTQGIQPGEFWLSFQGELRRIQIDLYGLIQVSMAGSRTDTLRCSIPRPVWIEWDNEDVRLKVRLPAHSTPQRLVTGLGFTAIWLTQDIETEATGRTVIERVSTIVSGDLYLESLEGSLRRIHDGQIVEFKKARGVIRYADLQENGVLVGLNGKVRGMSTRIGDNRWSMMPSILDWLLHQHQLALLWGATIYIFGLIVSIGRWEK